MDLKTLGLGLRLGLNDLNIFQIRFKSRFETWGLSHIDLLGREM